MLAGGEAELLCDLDGSVPAVGHPQHLVVDEPIRGLVLSEKFDDAVLSRDRPVVDAI